jgi:hypothetical protein
LNPPPNLDQITVVRCSTQAVPFLEKKRSINLPDNDMTKLPFPTSFVCTHSYKVF